MLDTFTIPLADLLATKLQVVEITERDYKDIICLLHDHDVGDSDSPETINGQYLARLCAGDWGIYKTFTVNLANVTLALTQYQLDNEYRETVQKHLQELQRRIESVRKTTRWKLRARIGEKVLWYELPERDKEIVDSRVTTA
jgi:hypothetical protein